MPTPVVIDGFEHGFVSVSGGWYSDATNASTTTGRNSGTALRLIASGTRQVRWSVSSTTVLVGVVYFKFDANPSADRQMVMGTSGARQFRIGLNTTGEIYAAIWDGAAEATRQTRAGALTVATWYRVEFRFITDAGGGSTYTIDWSVGLGDDAATAQTQASSVQASGQTVSLLTLLGADTLGTILDYDDVVLSATTGDFPIGPVTIKGYLGNASGTHSLDASPSVYLFEHNGTTAVALTTGETAAGTRVDDSPISGSTDYIYVTGTPGGTEYAEINFANTSGQTQDPMAVAVHESVRQDTALGSVYTSKVSDNGTDVTNVTTAVDLNLATEGHRGATLATKPSGGAWTIATVDSLRYRFGYTADATPHIRLYGLMAEVAYPIVAAAGRRMMRGL